MGLVFCRGCGKEIHESAPTCPHCGATQEFKIKRNIFALIFVSLGWFILFWLGFLFISGIVIGFMDPENAQDAGTAFGEEYGFSSLVISFILSTVLTYLGKLPGTYKVK